MKKHLLCTVAGLAATFGLYGVNAHAQDVTDSASTQAVNVVPAEPAAPAAIPAPSPRPAFLSGGSGVTVFTGYSFLENSFTQGNDDEGDCGLCDGRQGANGFELQGTWWLNPNFGLTADGGGNTGVNTFTDSDGSAYRVNQDSWYFLFGPSVQKNIGKVNLFAHALVGVARLGASDDYRDSSTSAFFRDETIAMNTGVSVGVGGGADYMFTHVFGWRIAQLDYLFSNNNVFENGCVGCTYAVNNLRISTGLIFHLGGAQ